MHSLVAERTGKGYNCSRCRGRLGLCGQIVCPIIERVWRRLRGKLEGETLLGASPPSVFIGDWNYPRVYAGPMVPPVREGDTSIMDNPARWLDEGMENIISYRLSLIRSHRQVDVHSAINPDRSLTSVQELAMASLPVDTEVKLGGAPRGLLSFSRWTPPTGPTAPLEELRLVDNPSVHPKVEYLTSDKDCLAQVAVSELYNSGISTYQLTRLLSAGLLGRAKARLFVPTKWSITAVDDVLGRRIHRQVLDHPTINEYRVFGCQAVGNSIGILLLPTSWMFEVLEYWVPGTIFPSNEGEITIPSDFEFTGGRKTYAKTIGGAYYAARLPVLEHLNECGKQAGAIVFLEVHPEWLPLGVWRVREICKRALSKPPTRFEGLDQALKEVSMHLTIPIKHWTRQSKILRYDKIQRTLLQFL